MPDRTSRLRAVIFGLALFCAGRAPAGSTALVRSELHTAPDLAPVRTYAGSVQASVSQVKPSPLVTVVLLTDSLSAAELETVKKDLATLLASLRGHPMRVAVLRNGSIGVAGPFTSRTQLKSALTEIANAPDSAGAAPPPAALDNLCASVGQLGGDWSRVLLVGELPLLEGSARDYASALLARTFGAAHLQLTWFAFSGGNEAWQPPFTSTGGSILHGSIADFAAAVNDASHSFFQVDWASAAPDTGFVISRSIVSDLQGGALFEGLEIAPAANFVPPSVEQYLALSAKTKEAEQLLGQDSLTDEAGRIVREDLRAALEINPLDPDALAAAAAFAERAKDYPAAARYRTSLTQVRPSDSATFAALGHALVLASSFDAAETPLQRAISLSAQTPQIAEDLARIRLARKDDQAALPLLEQALAADAKRQDLWFMQAQAAERLQNLSLAVRSYEQGLALGGTHVSETTSLVRLYLHRKEKDKASALAGQLVAALPADPAMRLEFAANLDALQLPAEALNAWRKVVEVQADSGPAHLRIAQLLLTSGDAQAAEKAADDGLLHAPRFAGLYVVKADALKKQGRFYSSRGTLVEGAAKGPDSTLLAHLAATEDTYGGLAAGAYARWAESLSPSSSERINALQRGFAVSLRDADFAHADSFAALLQSAGLVQPRLLMGGVPQNSESGTLVPGGLDALAFAALAKEGVPPERFFVEYARAVVDRVPEQPTKESKLYVQDIEDHFQRIAALQAFGKRDGGRLLIPLSANKKEALHNAEKVLDLLGLKLRVSQGQVAVESGEKKDQARKQDTASALAIDQVGLQEALKAGKTYTLEIPYEWATVYPDEKLWRENFYAKESSVGGFATALLRSPKVARLYIGISYLDHQTVSELLAAVPLKALEEHYADLLELYAPALAVEGGHAVVPGGRSAEAIWARLAGASPATPGAFFRALLGHENGKLLAFFFDLSQLDREHQSFFTANEERTSKFYRYFADSDDVHRGVSVVVSDSAFAKFMRSVPLDGHGHVDFPGSPEVWTVAKGRASSETEVAKMMKRASAAVAPDIEDELLLRLAATHYRENAQRHTELENFLAVARVDAHHTQPLDDQSALVLAQNYVEFSNTYAYFMEITGLSSADYAQFFAALQRMKAHPPLEANLQLGQFHSLVAWICLLQDRHVLDAPAAAKLFRYVCDRFNAADSPASYSAASLESVRGILNFKNTSAKSGASADQQLRALLLGTSEHGSVEKSGRRSLEFQRVLVLQKTPSLAALFGIYDGVTHLAAQQKADIGLVKKLAADLPSAELPKTVKVTSNDREFLARFEPAPLQKTIAEMSAKLDKRKNNSKDLEKAAQEVLGALQPQVTLALAGQLYAYYLRPTDMVVSEDALLLRKHHYFLFDSQVDRKYLVPPSAFVPDSQGAGSYFVGGFAQFSLAAGEAVSAGLKAGGAEAQPALAAQLAAIRSAAWSELTESDQRLVSLRISVAREWVVESALHADLFQALGDESVGLLSLSRRADLLNGIELHNWKKVWDSVTLPELFMLGGKYLDRFKTDPWSSPVTSALRVFAAGNDGSRLNVLGAVSFHSLGCSHTHLLPDAPYEEYARQEIPDELAERSAEFKLFLAFQSDTLGLDPSSLTDIAEPLAVRAFRTVHMSDRKDWRSLLAAFGMIQSDDLKQALEQ